MHCFYPGNFLYFDYPNVVCSSLTEGGMLLNNYIKNAFSSYSFLFKHKIWLFTHTEKKEHLIGPTKDQRDQRTCKKFAHPKPIFRPLHDHKHTECNFVVHFLSFHSPFHFFVILSRDVS